jgi:hypothetical protein
MGHWRIGPYDIEDILLDIPEDEAEMRKEEIIGAVRKIYSPETTTILHYNSQKI